MFNFLLILQALVAAVMIGVILIQRSEGGGLGVGGSPTGLISARGAADVLTRATAILAVIFVGLSIALASIASMRNSSTIIDTSLSKAAQNSATGAENGEPIIPAPTVAPELMVPLNDDPLTSALSGDGRESQKNKENGQGQGIPLEQ